MSWDDVAFLIVMIIVGVGFVKLTEQLLDTPFLSDKDRLDIDHQTCEQMRQDGWSEEDIKDWMAKHSCDYDMDSKYYGEPK